MLEHANSVLVLAYITAGVLVCNGYDYVGLEDLSCQLDSLASTVALSTLY